MSKKKMVAVFAGALVVALALPAAALAAPGGGFGQLFASCQGQGLGMAIMRSQATVDQACGRAFVDADGDGVCDNYAAGNGCGRGYVDENGDGVCDNGGRGGCGAGAGQGAGSGYGGRHHRF